MSKTYLDQLHKAKTLVAGLKKNYEQIKFSGISRDDLDLLESSIAEGEKLNAEVERLHLEINEAFRSANQKLIVIKDKSQSLKRIVKRSIDSYRWSDFGVMDKR